MEPLSAMTIDLLNPPLPIKGHLNWGNLHGCSLALALAQAATSTQSLLIVLTADPQTSQQLKRELKIFLHDETILHFPDWETLPYDNFSPHQDIISDRLSALSKLTTLKKGILIVPITTTLFRLCPKNYITSHSFTVSVKSELDWERMRAQLLEAGYQNVSQVMAHGEFARRGSIIDIFPMGSSQPIRIDLFDDEIDSLRLFDPETQRSDQKVDLIECLPAREFPLSPQAISLFRQQWRATFAGNSSLCSLYQDISRAVPAPGIEYYLPLFFEETSSLFDYLPPHATIVRTQGTLEACQQFWQGTEQRYEQYRHDIQRPILPPASLFFQTDEVFARLKSFKQIIIQNDQLKTAKNHINFATQALPDLTIEFKAENPFAKLQHFIQQHNKILFCAESPGRREALLTLLAKANIHPKPYSHWREFIQDNQPLGITIASFDQGTHLYDRNWVFIAENQLFGQQVMQRRRRQTSDHLDPSIRTLAELNIGAPVVHIDHGVGRYAGLTHLTVDNQIAEYLILEYANQDKLYVPVSSLHLISQYSGGNPPLHKLGTDHWDKAKKKAAAKAYDVAAELLEVYSQRQAKKGYRFSKPTHEYFQFANSFPFEETPDQTKAIQQVLDDMQSAKPMDRLICGDVGFGKTEVAMRATFIAVCEGKQIVVLVPTTLLAQQHFETFSDRFADWPFRIEVLSRFRSKPEQEKILKELISGQIDIIIGTHKLLHSSIRFKNLGLMIIDEEHRFGVRQKEKLKALRAEIDILTLTATPIPRTLNMALASLRDLSIIATPPAKRLSIKTFVRPFNQTQVHEAILRELMRSGQVYYLHNNVETIEKTAQKLAEDLIQAKVKIAHGQMREKELEKVMSDFYHQRFNVLVCTTIIETGIDIPTANTIIIERADKLGLAQLHQLRGRVGRSHHQAYAYCLTPPQLTIEASKRLKALESLEELGAGFTLATHDLEIRGSGELLGEEQSGNIDAIGFSLYMELLEKSIKSLQSGQKIEWQQGAEINLNLPALIPENYLNDVHQRLVLYKRIANAKDLQMLEELQIEMIDCFGLLPQATQNLFKITALKIKAQPIGVRKIEAALNSGKIEFTNPSQPEKIIDLIRKKPAHFKLSGSEQVKFMFDMNTSDQRFQVVEDLLDQLA